MRAIVVLADPANDRLQDFYITMLGRPTTIVFSDEELAGELARAVSAAWVNAGYIGAVFMIDGETTEEAIANLITMWPEHRKNAFLAEEEPAVVALMEWLRQGGRLDGPRV